MLDIFEMLVCLLFYVCALAQRLEHTGVLTEWNTEQSWAHRRSKKAQEDSGRADCWKERSLSRACAVWCSQLCGVALGAV